MANIEKIVLPDNTEYDIKDANALPLSAGSSVPLTGDLHFGTGYQQIGGHNWGGSRTFNSPGISLTAGSHDLIAYTDALTVGTYFIYGQFTYDTATDTQFTGGLYINRNGATDAVLSRTSWYNAGTSYYGGNNISAIITPADFDNLSTMSLTFGVYISKAVTQRSKSLIWVRLA